MSDSSGESGWQYRLTIWLRHKIDKIDEERMERAQDARYYRWVHRYPWMEMTAVLVLLGMIIGVHFSKMPWKIILLAAIPIIFFSYAWGTRKLVLAVEAHEYALCHICAANVPEDPARAVVEYDWMLRLAHAHLFRLLILAGIAAESLLAVVVLSAAGLFLVVGALATGGVVGVLTSRANSFHILVKPWCPYCKWDGEGQPELTPNPDPSMTKAS
jgi:hypothetical protein